MKGRVKRRDSRVTVKVYVTPEEKERLERRAARLNRSLSNYLAAAGLGEGLEELWSVLATVDLRVMNQQLKRLADRAEEEGVAAVREELDRLVRTVHRAAGAVAALRFTGSGTLGGDRAKPEPAENDDRGDGRPGR